MATSSTTATYIQGTRATGRGPASTYVEVENPSVTPAPRIETTYVCPKGHDRVVSLYVEAEVPETWVCRCGLLAGLATAPEVPDTRADGVRPAREGAWYTAHHRNALYARRSTEDLESLLGERLALLRAARAETA